MHGGGEEDRLKDERQRAWKRRRQIWEMRDREHEREEDRFKRWETESRERGRLRMHLGLGLEKHTIYTCFFLSVGLVEPVQFGSV